MKKNVLLFTLTGIIAFVTLKSDSSGPGGNYTGSGGGTVGCTSGGGCHGTTATAGVKLGIFLDSAGVPVSKYIGGMTYTLVLTDTNTTASSLPKHGFECSVVSGSGTSSVQAGTWGTMPAGTATHTTGGRVIWGHNTKLNPASGTGGTGTVYVDSVRWTAPVSGTGTVTFFSVMNDVNNDGSDNSNDKWNGKSVSFPERPSLGTPGLQQDMQVTLFPNPVSSVLNITTGVHGAYTVQVYNIYGRQMLASPYVFVGEAGTINTAEWPSGIYVVDICSGSVHRTLNVIR